MAMYIGLTTPSSELDQSDISKAITDLAAKLFVINRKQGFPEGPEMDVTFMLSTHEEKPDFNGMRMGGFTEENQTLYFETAVPAELCFSSMAADYLRLVLYDVIDNAADFFAEHEVSSFNKNAWLSTLESLLEQSQTPTVLQ